MTALMNLLGTLASLFGLAVLIRVVITWFDNRALDGPARVLARVTDPYLDWFRRFEILRTERIDFSPVAALAVLSFVQNAFFGFARSGRIGIGILISVGLTSAWSIVSFGLFFCTAILVLYLISQKIAPGSIQPFWRMVEQLGRPILTRINLILHRDRIVSFRNSLIAAIVLLMAANIGGGIAIGIVSGLLAKLPF